MKRISVRATEMFLKDQIKENKEFINNKLREEHEIRQGKEINESIKKCLQNEEAEQLILDWNKLIDKAQEIKKQAEKIDLTFAHCFKLN